MGTEGGVGEGEGSGGGGGRNSFQLGPAWLVRGLKVPGTVGWPASLFTAPVPEPSLASRGPLLFSRQTPVAELDCLSLQQRSPLAGSRESQPWRTWLSEKQRNDHGNSFRLWKGLFQALPSGKRDFIVAEPLPCGSQMGARECVFTCPCAIFLCFGAACCPLGPGPHRLEGTRLTGLRVPDGVRPGLSFQLHMLPGEMRVL